MLPRAVPLILAATGLLVHHATAFSPDDLAAEVTIRRDTYGVPRILAKSEPAAAFGFGYASAEDRVELMAQMYLKGRGEAAKHFGPEHLQSDLWVKRFRNVDAAQYGYDLTGPHFKAWLDAFAAGYNRYLEHHRPTLPDWIQPITPVDIIAHARRVVVMEFCMNLNQIGQIDRLLRQQTAQDSPKTMIGSNMWAINKDRSATGNALLLGNPHLAWSDSHVWIEAQITVPGVINYMGATLVGFPMLALGFNESLGWSHTVNPHDCDDIYELTLDPQNEHHYLYGARSIPMQRHTVTVQLKTGDDIDTRTEEVFTTHYGPVVKRANGKAYAYKSPNFDEYRFLEQWHAMTKTTNLVEFRRVLDMQAIPMFNIAYADAGGNCYFICNGRFPDRTQGYTWHAIVPGGIPETEWSWILPQNRLPQLLNPQSGYVQNCNSAPWFTNLDTIIDRAEFPAEIFPNGNDLRSQLSLLLIENNPEPTIEDLMRDKFNMNLLLADRVKPDLLKIIQDRTVNGVDLNPARQVLADWDNTVARNSKGAVLFVNFWRKYRQAADPVFEATWDERQPIATPHGIGDAQAALNALAETVTEMTQSHGALDIPWGQVHRLRHGDLDLPIGGLTGDFGAFRVIGYAPAPDGTFTAAGGDSYVFAVEFSQPIRAYSILAYSQSGDPDSPHYADQSAMFANNQFKPAWFYEEDLQKNLKLTYRIGKSGIEPALAN